MPEEKITEKLYASYGRTSDAEIISLLGRINIVRVTHKGVGSEYGYYTIDDKTMEKILAKPRSVSHTWDHAPNKLVRGLREFKSILFLVKSSSRFCLKPDIGEVFDAMSEEDKVRAVAIETLTEPAVVVPECSNADHFICTAILFE